MAYSPGQTIVPVETAGSRLTLFLPFDHRYPDIKINHEKAFNAVLQYLTETEDVEGVRRPPRVEGLTQGVPESASFIGHWWSEPNQKWTVEPVVLIIIDLPYPPEDQRTQQLVKELAAEVHRKYEYYDSKQEAVLIAMQDVTGRLYKLSSGTVTGQ